MKPGLLLALSVLMYPGSALAGPASDAVMFFYSPVKFAADPQFRDRFTDPVIKLFQLNDAAIKKHPDEVACIDFDPSLDAQDYDDKSVADSLKLAEAIDRDKATVTASFNLFSEGDDSKREMVWELRQVDGSWKVADIASKSNSWKLSELGCSGGEEAD
ncbi:hypothetical protein MAUB1S_11037 [Mycolicibacterium aubagnense]